MAEHGTRKGVSRPSGTQAVVPCLRPSSELLGYCRPSLRDEETLRVISSLRDDEMRGDSTPSAWPLPEGESKKKPPARDADRRPCVLPREKHHKR